MVEAPEGFCQGCGQYVVTERDEYGDWTTWCCGVGVTHPSTIADLVSDDHD